MEKPNIRRLPTSQMQAYCDLLGLGKAVQENTLSMVKALEAADFSTINPFFQPDETFIREYLEQKPKV